MSKFFKALEKVDQERSTDQAAGPTPPPTTSAPDPVVMSAAAEAVRAAHTPAPPETAAPPVVHATPVPPAPPVEPAPVYGAPIARHAEPATPAGHGFAWQMEPPPGMEAGEVDGHLVSLLEPTGFAAEQYRTVRLAIETFRREQGIRLVGVSSPGRGEGKTITAINLAGALAQAPDARVALVDADLRHPGVARYLGLPPGPGLSSYLLDPTMAVDTIVARPGTVAFAVVTAGPVSSMPYELLKSPRLIALFRALRERFDFVVLDTPSVLPFPDVGILRDAVDGFVLVVRANRTPREMLRESVTTIGQNRALGLVWNDDDRTAVSTYADTTVPGGWRRYLSLGASPVA